MKPETKHYLAAYLTWTLVMFLVGRLLVYCSKQIVVYGTEFGINPNIIMIGLPLIVALISLTIGFCVFRATVQKFVIKSSAN